MPEDKFGVSNVYYGIFDPEDPDAVKWQEVGEPVSISLDDGQDEPCYEPGMFDEQSGTMTFKLDMPWFFLDDWLEIFTGRRKYTVRRLNRHKSYRGKWHRGGKGRI